MESSEFNEVVQIDRQKICMTDSGCNQILVTLVKMLRVYCSRYMTDWDKHLPQVHAELNNRDQFFHDVDWQEESNAPDIILSGILREEDVAAGVREGSGQDTTRIERAL